MPVNKRQAKLGLFFPRLAQAIAPRHKLRAGKSAGTPFLGSAFRKEQSSGLDLAQFNGSWSKATAGTGLTIRSSRARFAASCKFLQGSLAQGRKAARLNSGVSAQENEVRAFKVFFGALLIAFFGSAQFANGAASASDTRAALSAALAHPAVDDFAGPDSVIVAQRIRQYVVVSVYQACAWRKTCKDGTLQVVFDPTLQKIVLVIGSG